MCAGVQDCRALLVCVCVCVRSCVRACVRACVHVRVHLCSVAGLLNEAHPRKALCHRSFSVEGSATGVAGNACSALLGSGQQRGGGGLPPMLLRP